MNSKRRNFIKTIGIAGIAATGLPQLGLASGQSRPGRGLKNKKGLNILFQGDSITDGNRTRNNDWNHILGHGYAYIIASRLWYDNIDKNLMFYNRGISGNKVNDLETRWQEDTLNLKPDIVSILAGVNDVHAIIEGWSHNSAKEFKNSYKRILNKTREALPETTIILCEPFILPVGSVKNNTGAWKEETSKRQIIVKELAKEYNTIFVGLQEPFNKACEKAPANYWIWDGVHPMPAGHELIARQWINEVKKHYSFV